MDSALVVLAALGSAGVVTWLTIALRRAKRRMDESLERLHSAGKDRIDAIARLDRTVEAFGRSVERAVEEMSTSVMPDLPVGGEGSNAFEMTALADWRRASVAVEQVVRAMERVTFPSLQGLKLPEMDAVRTVILQWRGLSEELSKVRFEVSAPKAVKPKVVAPQGGNVVGRLAEGWVRAASTANPDVSLVGKRVGAPELDEKAAC